MRYGIRFLAVMVMSVAVWASAGGAAAAGLAANVAGGNVVVNGGGFFGNERVQVIGVRYDGSTVVFGETITNAAGQFAATVPYADTALFQIDVRGYGSGAHAVGNIVGGVPFPVVPPGYPYVTPTCPDYVAVVYGTPNGYPNTGYPYTGAPYGGGYPGPGFGYPVPPSGVVLNPAINPGGAANPSDFSGGCNIIGVVGAGR